MRHERESLDDYERKAQEVLARASLVTPKPSHWQRFRYYYLFFAGLALFKFLAAIAR